MAKVGLYDVYTNSPVNVIPLYRERSKFVCGNFNTKIALQAIAFHLDMSFYKKLNVVPPR